MEELPLNRVYLETLATGDLIKIADNLGVDITQNPDRTLLIEELLEVSSLDSDESNEPPEQEMKDLVLVESVPLPRYYNVTSIEVMIRDPFWAFVFWEIKASDKEQLEKAQDFNGYYLRVNHITKPDASSRQGREAGFTHEASAERGAHFTMEEVFTVQVKPEDTAWYLGFAPTVENEALAPDQNQTKTDQNQYKVELCAGIGDAETVLAVSNTIRMPGLPELSNRTGKRDPELSENQLVRLSGYGDFHVLRRNERPLRAKKEVQSPNE